MDVILPKPGVYVVAVSGGVDSVVLLHLLQQEAGLRLAVAHFDHGIRQDSDTDRQLVQNLAKNYGLPFVYDRGQLGSKTSEDVARKARYGFLRTVKQASGASAIMTAHHQDDVLETAIINLLRGSGRKGLTSLGNQPDLLRPLLRVPKNELIMYAKEQGLVWNEDSTNQDLGYLRNYVRHKILAKFDNTSRQKLWQLITDQSKTNEELDALLVKQLGLQPVEGTIDRQWFGQLPHAVAKEMMASWLRSNGIRGFDSKTLERLVQAAKTASAGKVYPILSDKKMRVKPDHLALTGVER